ncbi:MAG: LysM peptidoglycan-binding domain-containing protein [Frankiales bacterium]|nr:LysM peptidoglycan-binding domain-containing protein [Frankiales bacterium]
MLGARAWTQVLDRALGADGPDPLVVGVLVVAALLVMRPLLAGAAAALAALPGRAGRAARRVADALRPGLARRALAVVMGLGASAQVAAPVAAGAAAAPVTSEAPRPVAVPSGEAAAHGTRTPGVSTGHARPGADVVARPVARTAGAPGTSPAPYVVVRGDTLWDIARRHLPPGAGNAAVARAWPQWYAANRAVIGPDPSLLLPGTRLVAPDLPSAGTPRRTHPRPGPHGSAADRATSLDPDRR